MWYAGHRTEIAPLPWEVHLGQVFSTLCCLVPFLYSLGRRYCYLLDIPLKAPPGCARSVDTSITALSNRTSFQGQSTLVYYCSLLLFFCTSPLPYPTNWRAQSTLPVETVHVWNTEQFYCVELLLSKQQTPLKRYIVGTNALLGQGRGGSICEA